MPHSKRPTKREKEPEVAKDPTLKQRAQVYLKAYAGWGPEEYEVMSKGSEDRKAAEAAYSKRRQQVLVKQIDKANKRHAAKHGPNTAPKYMLVPTGSTHPVTGPMHKLRKTYK
jgi:hypothetical protein